MIAMRALINRLYGRARSLPGDQRGMAAVEFGIIAPVMVVAIIGTTTYFVMGREDYRARRATFTAADMVSRQTAVTNSFLSNVKTLAEHIATSNARTLGFRVTSASKTADGFAIDWSYATTPYVQRTSFDGSGAPDISNGESIIMVETSTPYRPMFSMFGTQERRRESQSFSRPRTVSRVAKTD